jgi:putative ABC transport system permease protein
MPELDETFVVDAVPGEMPSDRVLHVKAFDLLALLPRAFEFRSELPGLFAPLGTGPDPRLLIGGRGIIVSATFAARRGLRAGDVLRGRIGAEPVALPIAAVFPRNTTSLDENVAVVDIATAQELFGTPGSYGRILATERPGAREVARRAVGNMLPPGASIVTANERRTEIEGMLAGFRASLEGLGILALLVASVLTYDAISTSVVRRRDDIATLRALGATRGAIAAAFLGEGAFLGALGGLVGVGGGTLLAQVAGVVGDGTDVYAADRSAPLIAFGAGLAVAIAAAIAPARAAAALLPTHAWAGRTVEERDATKVALPTVALGCAVLGTFAVFFTGTRTPALGIVAMFAYAAAVAGALPLAIRAVARTARVFAERTTAGVALGFASFDAAPRRLAVSVATLTIAIALATDVGTFQASFRASLERYAAAAYPGDLAIRPLEGDGAATAARFPSALLPKLQLLPGVARVSGTRTIALRFFGRRVVLESRAQGGNAAGTVVDRALAVHSGLRPGDSITFAVAGKVARLRVARIADGDPTGSGAIVLDSADFVRVTRDRTFDSIAVWLHAGTDIEGMRVRLAAFLAPRALEIRSTRTLRESLVARFDGLARDVMAVAAMAVVAAGFGVATALVALVLEYRAEIELLRRAGLTRRGVSAFVLVQAVAIGALGGGAGVVLGLAFALVTLAMDRASFGWSIQPVIPLPFLFATFAASVAVAAIAGIGPARIASKMPAGRALRAFLLLAALLAATTLDLRGLPATGSASSTARLSAERSSRSTVWRILGHLHADDGSRYDVGVIFGRYGLAPKNSGAGAPAATRRDRSGRSPWNSDEFYASDFSIVDEDARATFTATRVERSGIGFAGDSTSRPDLDGLHDLHLDGWALRARSNGSLDATIALRLADGSTRVELSLVPQQASLALAGLDAVAVPRLAARGTLFLGARRVAISGIFWIDRSAGSADVVSDARGWERFTIQFDDGRELLVRFDRDRRTGRIVGGGGTYIDRARTAHYLGARDLTLENPLATTWRNPRGEPYPSLWELYIPKYGLDLALVPDVQAQEIDPHARGARFYLGSLSVERAGDGPRDTGRGYAELAGFSRDQP